MVQLKSFRLLEPEIAANQQTLSGPGESPDPSSSFSGSDSTSTMAGGNLTVGSEDNNTEASERRPSASSDQQQQQQRTSEASSLSTNEEFQSAHYSVDDDEDESQSDKSEQRSRRPSPTDQVTRIDIEHNREAPPVPPKPARAQVSIRLKSPAPAPLSPLEELKLRPRASSVNSITRTHQPNQFEIRWQNLSLFARRSRVPGFIEDSAIYRLLKGRSQLDPEADPLSDQVCYSPPVQHKIPPTIIEEQNEKDPQLSANSTPKSQKHQQVAAAALPPPSSPLPLSYATRTQSIKSNQLTAAESQLPTAGSSRHRTIINNISGSVFSGQLTAVLGPSGVGKTSLLNSLTGRNTLEGIGRVALLGAESQTRLSVVTVPQNDVLPDKLTVLEDLQFTSRLKNPNSSFDHAHNIERIVKHLQMSKFINTRIEKLSGGEARRLSIARELLSSPDIMILDEPTSGLDANTCKKIISALRDIVEHSDNILDRPMSIIVTIHQPQREVLNLFHRVYVMAIGGRAIYEGPPSELLPTLLGCSSLSRVCAADQMNENPAIVAIEVASGEYGSDIIDELALSHEYQVYDDFSLAPSEMGTPMSTPYLARSAQLPRKSPLVANRLLNHQKKRLNALDNGSISGRPTPVLAKRYPQQLQQGLDRASSMTSLSYASTYDGDLPKQSSKLKVDKRLRRSVVLKSHFLSHTMTLMSRSWRLTTRNMFLMSIRIIGFLLVALGIVQIFAAALKSDEHVCPKYQTEVSELLPYMGEMKDRLRGIRTLLNQSSATHMLFFYWLLCLTMVSSAITGLIFPLQIRMFVREYKNGWYSPASFIMSNTLAELPVDIIGPVLTLLIVYPLCDLPASQYQWRELCSALVLILTCLITKSQAQIIGGVLKDSVENSVFMSCVAVALPSILSGIPVRVIAMTPPMQILSYTSFLRYSFESMMILRFGYGMCPCDSEVVDGFPVVTSAEAIPPQLDRFTRGFLEYNRPANESRYDLVQDGVNATLMTDVAHTMVIGGDEDVNIFVGIIRLLSASANLFVSNMRELGTCTNYRSLFLMQMHVDQNSLPIWIGVMMAFFIVSRLLTYYVVKAVIRFSS